MKSEQILTDKDIKDLNEFIEAGFGGIKDNLSQNRFEKLQYLQTFKKLMKKFKLLALLFVAYSIFNIVNDCIGLSSGYYYFKHTDCDQQVIIDSTCQQIKRLTASLYMIDLIAAFIMLNQAVSIYALIENPANHKVIKFCKIFAILSIVCFILNIDIRVYLFIGIYKISRPITNNPLDEGYGTFLAPFAEYKELQIILTTIFIVAILICFCLLIRELRLIKRLIKFNYVVINNVHKASFKQTEANEDANHTHVFTSESEQNENELEINGKNNSIEVEIIN